MTSRDDGPSGVSAAIVGVALVIVAGAVIETRTGSLPPSSTAPVVAASASAALPASAPRDVSARCRAVRVARSSEADAFIDPVISAEHPEIDVRDGGRMSAAEHYRVLGWGLAAHGGATFSAVCLVVDGNVDARAKAIYGLARPDVAAAYHRDADAPSGFEIDMPAHTLAPGAHRIEVAGIAGSGGAQLLPGARNVTVY
jgi:hypothetical protein